MTKYVPTCDVVDIIGKQEQLDQTVSEVKRLMFSGLARTLQVTLCTPLDYTPYHKECQMAGVLLTDDYDDFDMSKLIVKTPIPHNEYYKAVKEMYSIAFHPKFIARQLWFLRTFRKKDLSFIMASSRARVQHVFNLTQASTLALDTVVGNIGFSRNHQLLQF